MFVIPAKAGIHPAAGEARRGRRFFRVEWSPACAGVTGAMLGFGFHHGILTSADALRDR